jgi:hypothetical protein
MAIPEVVQAGEKIRLILLVENSALDIIGADMSLVER